MADWRAPLLASLLSLSTAAQADKSFCFAMAASYFEQLYCEVQARGEGRSLPAFYQFQKNNEQTQALLLKRPAARLGIKLKTARLRPHKPNPTPQLPAALPAEQPATVQPYRSPSSTPAVNPRPVTAECQLSQRTIQCQGQHYALLTNRHNRHLGKNALSAENRLALPVFTGDYANEIEVREYLYAAYARYLDRMHAIGLGGVATRFDKFSYLFYDYRERGLNFPERFETLYHYLKKDKASLPVSETPADTQGLTLDHCAALSDRFYICQWRNQNLVFATDYGSKSP